ncbi:MAG: DUF4838 domain-containing protein, partial [Planctomycetes bacterium]|nr:DUF4838 domain-containing protein [Planctomycetota bacterium]
MWIASAWIVAAAALCGIRAADASSSPYESPSSRPELELPIVAAGRPVARVLVAGEDETLEAAVSDFTQYVERISSARLEVARGTADLPGPTLHVGETELYERTADAREAVRVDGFALAKSGEDLIVAGRIPQGTANGLWTILQDRLGVRWYHAGPLWEVVPRQESLSIRFRPNAGSAARVENPSFLGRFYWGAAPSAAFARRSRLTQKGTPLPYVSTGHALDRVVPLEEYAAAHPEYFALIDGRRVTDRVSHPCFTHPDMLDVFMKYVRAGGTTFGVNDNLDACHCERCLAVDGASERYLGMWNVSESYFQLMARVARQTAEEFPGRRLGVFAYQLTNAPPRTVDPIGENIDVVLCQDTSQHFDPRVRAMDQRMAVEWTRKAGGVSLYDYYGIDYWTPRYFPRLLAGQLKHLAACGVKGYQTHATTMIDSSMPMFYLYGRLLWNADLDPRQLIDEMLDDLYGEAAEPMRRFYDHW